MTQWDEWEVAAMDLPRSMQSVTCYLCSGLAWEPGAVEVIENKSSENGVSCFSSAIPILKNLPT